VTLESRGSYTLEKQRHRNRKRETVDAACERGNDDGQQRVHVAPSNNGERSDPKEGCEGGEVESIFEERGHKRVSNANAGWKKDEREALTTPAANAADRQRFFSEEALMRRDVQCDSRHADQRSEQDGKDCETKKFSFKSRRRRTEDEPFPP
jgi:hypothetical protein